MLTLSAILISIFSLVSVSKLKRWQKVFLFRTFTRKIINYVTWFFFTQMLLSSWKILYSKFRDGKKLFKCKENERERKWKEKLAVRKTNRRTYVQRFVCQYQLDKENVKWKLEFDWPVFTHFISVFHSQGVI